MKEHREPLTARQIEHAKYRRAYGQQINYRMKAERRADAMHDLAALPVRGSYLDVACGQGDMLDEATRLGFSPVQGTEIVPALLIRKEVCYAEVHRLPFLDKTFNVVTMFDVIEHLLPGDDEAACKELMRVARHHILLTANNRPSHNRAGDVLHINIKDYAVWDNLFRTWFSPHAVAWIKGKRSYISEAWRIDL